MSMENNIYYISPDNLEFANIVKVMQPGMKLALSEEAVQRIERCRNYLDHKIAASD